MRVRRGTAPGRNDPPGDKAAKFMRELGAKVRGSYRAPTNESVLREGVLVGIR